MIFLTAPNFVNISNFPHFSFFSKIQLPYFNRKPISVIDIRKACDISFSVPSIKIQGTEKLENTKIESNSEGVVEDTQLVHDEVPSKVGGENDAPSESENT